MQQVLDPLDCFDWAAHWRALVEARAAQLARPHAADYWDRRAGAYHCSMAAQPDPFLAFMESFAVPRKTLIDVGAGSGRHCAPLADRLDWVTAVEPSENMRALIPQRQNLTIVASGWEDASVAAADLVICCHVLYPIAEPLPFIRKLEEVARERVFVYMRDRFYPQAADQLWELMAGRSRARQPHLYDLYNLLHWAGIQADLTMLRYPVVQRFQTMETAVEDCRLQVGESWDEDAGRRWLGEHLVPQEDGGLLYDAGPMVSGVAHWKPLS